MRILKRELVGMIAVCMAGVGLSQNAFAQAAPEPAPAPAADPAETETCDPECPQPVAAPEPAPAPEPQPIAEVPPPAPTYYEEPAEESWIERVGIGFAIGGGVDDFASDTMRSTTGTGGGWNVRMTLGTNSYVAFEGSYIGSAQTIDALGLDNDAYLVGNGLQAALRVNVLTGYVVQPFLYGGAAWRHYDLTNNDFNTSDVSGSDDVGEMPLGVGISGYFAGMMADLRGEYRWAWAEDLAPSRNNSGEATLDRWAVTANLGFAYY